jgi:hypothetical protein
MPKIKQAVTHLLKGAKVLIDIAGIQMRIEFRNSLERAPSDLQHVSIAGDHLIQNRVDEKPKEQP